MENPPPITERASGPCVPCDINADASAQAVAVWDAVNNMCGFDLSRNQCYADERSSHR